ncbi:DUF2214 family protein [Marinoscillum sp.]|uniref:DUF2214 family protein n=1 Tax=Marinoscillum sp. TaxID=2024838 RepID=UPI003BA8789E
MIDFILVKYVHFIGIFAVVGSLVGEALLLKPELKRSEIARLSRVDMVYGLATMVVLGAGFTLWFAIGKPADFYSYNWIFILKLVLFTLVGILSIIPTVFFMKNRKGEQDEYVSLPAKIRNLIYAELAILLLIPLCAVLMANGLGTF